MNNQADQKINELDARLQQLEAVINNITERNTRVELDKAWETSRLRVLSVAIVTYIITAVVFWMIGVERPLVNALIPTTGFYLSTQTLPILKEWWIQFKLNNNH